LSGERRGISLTPATLSGLSAALDQGAEIKDVVRELPINEKTAYAVTAIIHESELDDIEVLTRAVRSAQAVGLLRTRKGPSTCFLVGSRQVLTNNHALVGRDNGRTARVEDLIDASVTFNFEQNGDGTWKDQEVVGVLGDGASLVSDRGLDFALLELQGDPGTRWGFLDLPDSFSLKEGQDVFIVQHPNGGPKQVALSGNIVVKIEDPRIRYTTDTVKGSSGSPVFDRSWNVAALHRGSWNRESNQGIRIDRIRERVEASLD
jgi:V8-like Glu-specific endopeptidase